MVLLQFKCNYDKSYYAIGVTTVDYSQYPMVAKVAEFLEVPVAVVLSG